MTARDRTLIVVDIIFAIIALICGTIVFTHLVKYAIFSMSLGHAAPWTWIWIGTMLILLIITVMAYRKIDHTPIRMLLIICLFVPQIVNLLLGQAIPFPEVWFLNT